MALLIRRRLVAYAERRSRRYWLFRLVTSLPWTLLWFCEMSWRKDGDLVTHAKKVWALSAQHAARRFARGGRAGPCLPAPPGYSRVWLVHVRPAGTDEMSLGVIVGEDGKTYPVRDVA